jgi:hypothetical protein
MQIKNCRTSLRISALRARNEFVIGLYLRKLGRGGSAHWESPFFGVDAGAGGNRVNLIRSIEGRATTIYGVVAVING